MPNRKFDNFAYKYSPMSSEKKKAVSDGEESFTSKILRFWENCKWIISPASRRKNNLPAENPKLNNPILFGWTRKFLKGRIFGHQTRSRNAGTETLTSEASPESSSAKSEKPGLRTPALRLEPGEYSDQREPAVPVVSISSLLNGRPSGKADKISARLDNESPYPDERDGDRLSVPVTLDCHALNSDETSTPFPALSHSNSPCCSALSTSECRTSGYRTPTPCKCTHWNVYPIEDFQRSRYSRESRLSSTDGGNTENSTEALERLLLHRNCPFKTRWHQDVDAFRKKSRRRRLDSGTSDRLTRGQRSFYCRYNSFPFSQKKRNVHCTCQLGCLGFNNHTCSANSTFCWRSRSCSPVCSRVTYDGNSNTTYCINTPPDDRQTPFSNGCLRRDCFCYACVSKPEHHNLRCSSRNTDPSIGESVLRRDVGTSTADLIETGHVQPSKKLSVDKTSNTKESLSKQDLGFEPVFSSSQPPHRQNKSFPRAKTGSRTSEPLQSSDLYKDCSRSLSTADSSKKTAADKGKHQFMSFRGEKRTKAQGITPFKYESTGGFIGFQSLHSNSCPLVRQLETLTPDAKEIVRPLPGYSMLVSKSQNAHPITKNAAHDTVLETNSNATRRPLDRGHEKPAIEDENGVLSDDCRASRRLKADAIPDSGADISKLKTEECLAGHGGSNQKAACVPVLDFGDGSFNKGMARCRSLKSKPELGALETLVRYFASTPKREGSQVKDKCPPCASRNLLNVAEETTTSTDVSKFPDLAAWAKSKTPTLPGGSATAAFSDCPRFQYSPNPARYTCSDFFSQPGFEKTFSLRDPAPQTNQDTNFSLKQKITTDNNSLVAESQNRIPWFAMNLTSCSKTSRTHYCSGSLNADKSEFRILDHVKPSVSNGSKFRRSSLSTRFSIHGDIESDEHETSYFPNSDNDVFDSESYKYDYIPLHQLETLSFPVI